MKIQTHNGIVAFCDILGYREILMRNDPALVATDVISILSTAKEDVIRSHASFLPPNVDKKIVTDKLNEIEWVTFTDSIVLLHAYPSDAHDGDRYVCWMVTIITLIYLFQHMLNKGLPIRGSISFGNYFHNNMHFAGCPIVEAYDHGQSLDLSAIALHDRASAELMTLDAFRTGNAISAATKNYPTPCKRGTTNTYLLYPYVPNTLITSDIKNNIERYLLDKFCAYSKSINDDRAKGKYLNTLSFYKYVIAGK